ncbi:MAG: formyltetrahydrofolate deformylase, partial [Sphingopyxis sp.]
MTQACWVLTFSCVDRVGIVAALTDALAGMDGFILDSQQYAGLDSGRFTCASPLPGAALPFPQ